jgi:hypothetical protein
MIMRDNQTVMEKLIDQQVKLRELTNDLEEKKRNHFTLACYNADFQMKLKKELGKGRK